MKWWDWNDGIEMLELPDNSIPVWKCFNRRKIYPQKNFRKKWLCFVQKWNHNLNTMKTWYTYFDWQSNWSPTLLASRNSYCSTSADDFDRKYQFLDSFLWEKQIYFKSYSLQKIQIRLVWHPNKCQMRTDITHCLKRPNLYKREKSLWILNVEDVYEIF